MQDILKTINWDKTLLELEMENSDQMIFEFFAETSEDIKGEVTASCGCTNVHIVIPNTNNITKHFSKWTKVKDKDIPKGFFKVIGTLKKRSTKDMGMNSKKITFKGQRKNNIIEQSLLFKINVI